MEQPKIENPDKLGTLGIQDTDRRKNPTTQKLTNVEQQGRIKNRE